ncbi:MAG: hypothetical protein AAB431_01890 [Patescibacteria group bacterium]
MAQEAVQSLNIPRRNPSASQKKSAIFRARRSAISPVARTNFRPKTAKSEEEGEGEGEEKQAEAGQYLQNAGRQMQEIASSQANRFKRGIAMAKAFNQMQAATEKEAKPTQDETRKFVTQAIPKIAGMLTMSLNLATCGLAFMFTFFIDFLILGWENLQMIYGRWIMKGKHKIVPPLSWDPIPMPFDGQALVLQMLLILKDLIFLIVMMLPFILMAFIFSLLGDLASAL